METIIKISPSELNEGLLDKIRKFIGERENVDVTISLKEVDIDYLDSLERSIEQAENNEIVSFTMQDFMAYSPIKN
jgi:hypothetical protein